MKFFLKDDQYMSDEPISLDGLFNEEVKDRNKYSQFNNASTFSLVSIELGMEFGNLVLFKEAVKDLIFTWLDHWTF